MNIKVAAVQLDLVQCKNEKQFFNLINNLTKEAVKNGAQVVVFPEDLGFCLAWAKESYRVQQIRTGSELTFQPLGLKSWLERFSDWLFSRIKLNAMGEWLAQSRITDIVKRVFSQIAYENNVVIVSGSIYEKKINGIYNVCYVFDDNGFLAGSYFKKKLVPIEVSWGVKPGNSDEPIQTREFKIGVVICYDLDDPSFIKSMCDKGAQFLVAPSGGWRPYPGYPFDKEKESPQIQRSIENQIVIVRPYCCGWLKPGLYFQGHTQIVGTKGEILAESIDWSRQKIFYAEVPPRSLN